jgi:GR25 family glycosyltransferase involved in LPS biosynthesis
MDNVPIFYINLERSSKRRARMEAMFQEHNLDRITRVEAFDGQKIMHNSELLEEIVKLPSSHGLSAGELGCSLSHLLAAEMILQSGHEYALVMEDDIHLTYVSAWKTSIQEIVSQAPADWQVILVLLDHMRKKNFADNKSSSLCTL